MNARISVPTPVNEPILSYAPGSPERRELKARLAELRGKQVDIALRIGGQEVRTGKTQDIRPPHDHSVLLGRFHKAGKKEVQAAIAAAMKARRDWANTPFHARA